MFSQFGEFYSNMLSSSAISHELLKEFKGPQRGGNRLDYPTSTTQTNNSSKKLVRILIIMTE